MSIADLNKKIQDIPIGSKVTVKLETYFGNYTEQKATLMGHPYSNGYVCTDTGAWMISRTHRDEYAVECFEVELRFYNKRKISLVKLGFHLYDIKLGW